jgi:RND family efflux transporter MFP subunit
MKARPPRSHFVSLFALLQAQAAGANTKRMTGGIRNHVLAAAFIAPALFAGCSRPGRTHAAGSSERVRVTAARAERKDLSLRMEIAAEFRPYREVDVYAKVAGYLARIFVDVGDRVGKGGSIGALEVPEMTAERAAESAALECCPNPDFADARADMDRARTAAPSGPAQARLAAAHALLAAAEERAAARAADAARMQAMTGYLRIAAPFGGVVTRRYVDPGAAIQAGTAAGAPTPIVRIAQVDRLRLMLPVPEALVPRIRPGSPVEVRVDSLQRIFEGAITRLSGELNPTTRAMDAEVDIPNSAGLIRPGMYGYATLSLPGLTAALAVPPAAVSHGHPATVIVIGPDGETQELPVTTGVETSDSVEILSGLREHDLVLTGSRAGLRPGARVEPQLISSSGLERGR